MENTKQKYGEITGIFGQLLRDFGQLLPNNSKKWGWQNEHTNDHTQRFFVILR